MAKREGQMAKNETRIENEAKIVNVGRLDDGRVLVYCPVCFKGHAMPAANDGETYYCSGCCEEKRESVELEEALRCGLILSTEDNELFTIGFRDVLAASLRDVA
jgi:hypothetical protein